MLIHYLILFLSSYLFASTTCEQGVNEVIHGLSKESLSTLCKKARVSKNCTSRKEQPIFHFDFASSSKKGKRILVIGAIHGDEAESAAVALKWSERLLGLKSRNSWRIMPIVNPDGIKLKRRTNANGVDINRNFPSRDWSSMAIRKWKKKEDPRRYPGPYGGSEPETRCIMSHIAQFRPDFIIAVHTPYGVLDFDGPKVAFPKFKYLPWVSLGTFPGSLGRYMWKDQNIPVLTIELKDGKILAKIDDLESLQDISGTVAIRAHNKLTRK